jgi:hypothetical protein
MFSSTLYAICSEDRFVYFDAGTVRFDDKMPRRSGTRNSYKEIVELRAKLERNYADNLVSDIAMIRRRLADPKLHIGLRQCLQERLEKLELTPPPKFELVKITFAPVLD